jgi:hypothetical protein
MILPPILFPGLTFKRLFTGPISECSLQTVLNIEMRRARVVQMFEFVNSYIIKQVALNKSSLLLKIQMQNTETLQLFTMTIESIYKSNLNVKLTGLVLRDRKPI